MKVMHLTFDMRIGGTEQVIKNLILGMHNDTEHSVLCIESPLGPFAEPLQAQQIEVQSLQRKPGFDTALIADIRKIIQANKIDILHCHQYTPWVYGTLAAFITGTKVIFTEHGRFYPDRSSWKRNLVNPWLHRITAATTAISSATQSALAEYENLPLADIQVVYNGIEPLIVDQQASSAIRESLGISQGELLLGTIARLDPIKNHSMMLLAFKQLLDAGLNAKLIIIGDGEMRGDIETLIEQEQLGGNVILTGYIAAPKDYLAAMDIFLLSSLSEGTSMTLLEAMSLAKPCVVTDAGGNPEIVANGVTGVVTKNDCADSFADGVMALKDSGTRERMGKQGLERFEALFSVKTMCTAYSNLYGQVYG